MMKNEIKEQVFLYTPSIPHKLSRTRGYGKTVRILVIKADKSKFKTLNSKHVMIKDFGTARCDYGTKLGYFKKVTDEAKHFMDVYNANNS